VYIPGFVEPHAQVRVEKVDAKYAGINKLRQFVAIEEARKVAMTEKTKMA
jgi:hypothetical protein